MAKLNNAITNISEANKKIHYLEEKCLLLSSNNSTLLSRIRNLLNTVESLEKEIYLLNKKLNKQNKIKK